MHPRGTALLIVTLFAAPALAGCFTGTTPGTHPGDAAACGLEPSDAAWPSGPSAGAGAQGEVTLRTDAYGVTHVYAEDSYSLFYGNGYVQARDRLWQMDLLRHVGYGDSAAIVGESQLASDVQVRRDLYTRDEIAAQLEAAPPWLQDALQAFSDGVNRRMAEMTAAGELPAEFGALGHAPEPWTPEDSVAVINYLIGVFGVAGGRELTNAHRYTRLVETTGSAETAWEALGDLNSVRVTTPAVSIPADERTVDGCERERPVADVAPAQLALAEAAAGATPWGVPEDVAPALEDGLGERRGYGLMDAFRWGSNALLVAGEHSATGKPVMFGGPQMAYYKPPVPYEVGLHGAGFDARGIGVVGAPGIVIGRTPTFAWSVTSGFDDQVDTVALELDPQDPHRYRWDGGWETMACRTETHRVATTAASPSPPRVVEQEACRAHGMPVVAWNPDANVAWAQRTTTRNLELLGASQWVLLAAQDDLDGFLDALETFPFTFNFLYADAEDVAYVHTGRVPLREPALDPRLPALAGDAHAWRGEVTGKNLGTRIVNPAQGYVAQWNNAPAHGWRAGDEPGWVGVHRVELLDRLTRDALAANPDGLTWAHVARILEDAATHDPFAPRIAPHLAQAARANGDAALAPLADALDAWRADGYPWQDADGDDLYDHPGHAVYDAARAALQARVFHDELGDTARQWNPEPAPAAHAGTHGGLGEVEAPLVAALDGRSRHAWCDDVTTPEAESCETVVQAALVDARDALVDAYGADPSAWLQPVHRSRFVSMGAASAEEIPMVNRGSWNQVVALGEGVASAKGVLPPGNRGTLTGVDVATGADGAHVRDQLDLYVDFGYKPLPVTPSEVEAVAVDTVTLQVVPPPRVPVPAR